MSASKSLDSLTENLLAKLKKGLAYALVGSTLLLGNGCATYTGHNKVEDIKVVESRPIVSSKNEIENIEVKIKKQELKEHAWYEYGAGNAAIETLLIGPLLTAGGWVGALLWPLYGKVEEWAKAWAVWPPVDFFVKVFGGNGVHSDTGLWLSYAENPPSYLTRLSQNTLTGSFNPFQCVFAGKGLEKSVQWESVDQSSEWKRADVALEELEKALNKRGNKRYEKASVNFAIGAVYVRTGLFDKATEHYRKAIESDREFLYRTYADLSMVYIDGNQYDKAEIRLREMIQELDKWKGASGAVDEFESLVKINPEDLGGRFCLAYIYEREGYEDKSIEEFKKIIEVKDNPFAHYALGNVYKRQSMDEKAEEEWKKALEMHPGFIPARLNLAVYYDESGKHNRAINQFTILASMSTKELLDCLKK